MHFRAWQRESSDVNILQTVARLILNLKSTVYFLCNGFWNSLHWWGWFRGEGSGEGQKRQTLLDRSTTEGCTALPFTHHTPQNIDNWKASVLNICVISLVARWREKSTDFVWMYLTMVCLTSLILLDPKETNGFTVDNMKSVVFKPHLRQPNKKTQTIIWQRLYGRIFYQKTNKHDDRVISGFVPPCLSRLYFGFG